MEHIKKGEIEIFEHADGKKYNTIVCPKCGELNYFLMDPDTLMGLLCENKQCREYLKIVE
jgi:phage FluMu protein Com